MNNAYGDESCGEDYVSYAFVSAKDEKLRELESSINTIKLKFGGSPQFKLHCRELFAGDARAKSSWSHLESNDVFQLYEELLALFVGTEYYKVVSIAKIAEFPKELPSAEMTHIEPEKKIPSIWTKRVPLKSKQLALFCAQGALIDVENQLGFENTRFWLDPDYSRVDWFHGKTKATPQIENIFIDIDPSKEPKKMRAIPISEINVSLLEIADCIAYTAQKKNTFNATKRGHKFKKLFEIASPRVVRFSVHQNGRFGFLVPK
ncbi:MAG: hypothetical protein Q7S99_14360 [Parvibaculum sp.]|nr:hypothetical protein [Parvibaculum sp.]